MTRAQRLKRVFRIEIEICQHGVDRLKWHGKADVQMPVFTFTEGPQVADFRLMQCNITVYCDKAP